MEWISVKDRLPEEGIEVLLKDNNGDNFLGGWNGDEWISSYNGDELYFIIYWCYIPQL